MGNSLGDNKSDFKIEPATVKSLQSLLSKTGFGYSTKVYDYKYNKATQDMVDQHSESATLAEKLYILCNQDEIYDYKAYGLPDDFLAIILKVLPDIAINRRRCCL